MPETVFYFMMEAVPGAGTEEARDCGGAFINCGVKAENEETARRKARRYVEEENWTFLREKDAFIARREFYADEPESLECFDEAREYGLSAAFYMWPKGRDA